MKKRETPFSQFNFVVDLGGQSDPVLAGFQEVSGLGMEVNVAEYRAGNSSDNAPQKIPGTYKVTDVTLKRGVVGSKDLFDWVKEVRNGVEDVAREVTITLRGEDRTTKVATWKLTNAFPTKYTAPALNAKGTDVAIEELTLACESIEMEE